MNEVTFALTMHRVNRIGAGAASEKKFNQRSRLVWQAQDGVQQRIERIEKKTIWHTSTDARSHPSNELLMGAAYRSQDDFTSRLDLPGHANYGKISRF